jgi:hypothetical protein
MQGHNSVTRKEARMQRLLFELRNRLHAPSRNPRTAVVIGRLLAIAFLLCFGTGIYSHFIQEPLPWMSFAVRPIWLYQVTQGVHIVAGILCFPLITAKLYAVYPELFQTPPIKGFASLLERASIALFVAASLVQITIGLLNTYQWYALFPFPFRQTHFALSFVIIGSLAIHIAIKLPIIAKYWRKADAYDASGALIPLERDGGGEFVPVAGEIQPVHGITGKVFKWIDTSPEQQKPQASRRGFFVIVGIASAALVTLTAGQSFKIFDATNVFGPRKNGIGPAGLPVNRTAKKAAVVEKAMSPDWKLTVINGSAAKTYSYAELQAMPQFEVELPIACVEGWSQMATWKGPRLRDLVDSVDGEAIGTVKATSLEEGSLYAISEMGPEFARDELTLVALEVNGETLDLDHGYPARLIAPARPGVLQTKWLSSLEVLA